MDNLWEFHGRLGEILLEFPRWTISGNFSIVSGKFSGNFAGLVDNFWGFHRRLGGILCNLVVDNVCKFLSSLRGNFISENSSVTLGEFSRNFLGVMDNLCKCLSSFRSIL